MPVNRPYFVPMDRVREGNRRASLGGAPISAPRKPRSACGLKDTSGIPSHDSNEVPSLLMMRSLQKKNLEDDEMVEEVHSTRLRDRPRKETSVPSAIARSKRSRPSSREYQPSSRTEDMEEVTETGEVGVSDEDDDPIQKVVLPRKTAKLKFHTKVPMDECNAVQIPAVPRKARTAFAKRAHESTTPAHRDNFKHGSLSSSRPSSPVTPFSSSPSPNKPLKRMKPNGVKIRPSKLAKVSPSAYNISEQEVEVAEALFDLARMVSSMGTSHSDDKWERNNERSLSKPSPQVSSPARTATPNSTTPVSSPVPGTGDSTAPVSPSCVTAPASDAAKRKHSRIKTKHNEGTLIQTQPSSDNAGDSKKAHKVHVKEEDATESNCSASASPESHQNSPSIPTPAQDSSETLYPVEIVSSEMMQSKTAKVATDIPSEHNAAPDTPMQKPVVGNEVETGNESKASADENQRVVSHSCKYEIDLMAIPKASTSGTSEKTCNSSESVELNQKALDRICASTTGVGKEENVINNDSVPIEGTYMVNGLQDKACESQARTQEKEFKDEKLKTNHADTVLATTKDDPKYLNLEPAKQNSCDMTGGMPGWPGSLPHMGYYPPAVAAAAAAAAVAAAWPAPGSITGPGSIGGKCPSTLQVPPFVFPGGRTQFKRCATHVYIAHFIDSQHQMQRHPLWAATFGNPAAGSLYSMKSFNFNNPVNAEANVQSLPGANASSNQTSNSTLVSQGNMIPNDAQALKDQPPSTYNDGIDKKGTSQKSQTGYLEHKMHQQAGLGPVFGFPMGGLPNQGGNKTNSSGQATNVASVNNTSNTDSVNGNAAQLQYLKTFMQQPGFPFSLPSGHFMTPNVGHMSQQQGAQFFGSPFYNVPVQSLQTHSTQSQQSAATRGATKGGSSQKPSSNMQQQQQLQLSSVSSSQSHQRVPSQHLHRGIDKETFVGAETASSAESKIPMSQRHTQGLGFSNIQTSSIDLSTVSPLPASIAFTSQQTSSMQSQTTGLGHFHEQMAPGSNYVITHNMFPKSVMSNGVKNQEYQSPQALPGMAMGSVDKNMAGPVPVAGIMTTQGHAILQTTSESERSQQKSLQEETYNTFMVKSAQPTHEKTRFYNTTDTVDGSQVSVKASRLNLETDSSATGSSKNKNGLQMPAVQHQISVNSVNFMQSPTGMMTSKQLGPTTFNNPSSVSPSTKSAPLESKRLPNTMSTIHDPMLTNKSAMSGAPLHGQGPNSVNQSTKQGQNPMVQHPPQTKSTSRMSAGSVNTSVLSSQNTYPGVVPIKNHGNPSRSQQNSPTTIQSKPSPIMSNSYVSLPSSSKSNVSKANQLGKSSSNQSQKQVSTPNKKQDPVTMQSSSQNHLPPSSVLNVHSQSQNLQAQQNHVNKQQQQHLHLQQLQQHQHVYYQNQPQHSQQPQQKQQQSHQQQHQVQQQQNHQQKQQQYFHMTSGRPTMTIQMSGNNQVVQQKQASHPQQTKQRGYSQQFSKPPPQQQTMQSQHTASHGSMIQTVHNQYPALQASVQHPMASNHVITVGNNTSVESSSAGKSHPVPSHQQPFSISNFTVSSSGVYPQSSPVSIGSGGVARPMNSDGNGSQLTNSKGVSSPKPPTGQSNAGHRINNSNSVTSTNQMTVVAASDVFSQPQYSSGSNPTYLPYVHSATYATAANASVNDHGASSIHGKNMSNSSQCASEKASNTSQHNIVVAGSSQHSSDPSTAVYGSHVVMQMTTNPGQLNKPTNPPPDGVLPSGSVVPVGQQSPSTRRLNS